MRISLLFLFLSCLSAWGQAPTPPAIAAPEAPKPAEVAPDTVVATLEGRKYTAGDLQKMLAVLPPQAQQVFAKDRKEFVRQLARLVRLSQLAEKSKLDQQSPYREQIELNRMTTLMQAEINYTHNSMQVSDEERKQFYDTHKDRFTQAKVKVIYIAFSPNAAKAAPDEKGKKPLTEAEAKVKAEEVLKKIHDGGDFLKLVKEVSDDPISVAENGDFGPIKSSDNIDPSIKKAVFALKPSEVSEPIRQPNGFYIFRLEDVTTEPFEKVKEQIFNEVKNQKLQQWLQDNDKDLKINIESEAYFAGSATPTAPPPPPSLRSPAK